MTEEIHIPIHGPAGDNDPATQQWREKNWVDEDTARARAYPEDGARTMGAKSRESVERLATYTNDRRIMSDDLNSALQVPEVTARFGKKRQRQEHARTEANERIMNATHGISNLQQGLAESLMGAGLRAFETGDAMSDARVANEHGEARQRHHALIEALARKAVEHDKRADEIGDWAEVLHKKPPSEAFLRSVSDLWTFTDPRDLWHIEHEELREEVTQDGVATIDRLGSEIGTGSLESLDDARTLISDLSDALQIYGRETVEEEAKRHGAEAREIYKEIYDKINSAYDDDMTVAQIKQRASELLKLTKILLQVEEISLHRALDDIRSGKAHDPDYKVEPIPTAQAAQELSAEAKHHAAQAEKWLGISKDREGPEKDDALRIAATHTRQAERAEAAARLRNELSPDAAPVEG